MRITSSEKKGSADVNDFYRWQHPRELRRLAIETRKSMSPKAFLSKGGDFEQKVQEALVGAPFAWLFSRLVYPVEVRMSPIHQSATDMELRSRQGHPHLCEITAAYPPGYKIREEYAEGKRPVTPDEAFSGWPIPAEWIASAIVRKTEKVKGITERRHLVVYNNIHGGATDLESLPRMVGGAEKSWKSIWVIAGIPSYGWVALVSGQSDLGMSTLVKRPPMNAKPVLWGYSIDRSGLRLFN